MNLHTPSQCQGSEDRLHSQQSLRHAMPDSMKHMHGYKQRKVKVTCSFLNQKPRQPAPMYKMTTSCSSDHVILIVQSDAHRHALLTANTNILKATCQVLAPSLTISKPPHRPTCQQSASQSDSQTRKQDWDLRLRVGMYEHVTYLVQMCQM